MNLRFVHFCHKEDSTCEHVYNCMEKNPKLDKCITNLFIQLSLIHPLFRKTLAFNDKRFYFSDFNEIIEL